MCPHAVAHWLSSSVVRDSTAGRRNPTLSLHPGGSAVTSALLQSELQKADQQGECNSVKQGPPADLQWETGLV